MTKTDAQRWAWAAVAVLLQCVFTAAAIVIGAIELATRNRWWRPGEGVGTLGHP